MIRKKPISTLITVVTEGALLLWVLVMALEKEKPWSFLEEEGIKATEKNTILKINSLRHRII